jgi:vancomycin resistance protein YoaR
VVVLLILAALVVILLAGGAAAVVTTGNFTSGDKIAQGVKVGGIPVAGMTSAEAQTAVEQQFQASLPAQITLNYPGGSLAVGREDLGLQPDLASALQQAQAVGREANLLQRLRTRWEMRAGTVDLPVTMTVDQPRLRLTLESLAPRINREPKDAKVSVTGTDTFNKVPGQTGVTLLVAESVQKAAKVLQEARTTAVDLVVKQQPPNISEKDLAGLNKVLSSFETPYHTFQTDRTHNMELAMAKVNGMVLQPGQEFSLNQTVGERTVQDGYRSAPIFKDGKVVPDTGGGICQVASTLYNMAMLANLEILEREHHSRPVWYCPTGRDATVYWGQHDLRFRNSLSHPILILGEIHGDHLWACCVGNAEDQYQVELIRSNCVTIGYSTETRTDPSQPAKYHKVDNPGNVGARATLSCKIYKNGQLLKSEKLHDDYYEPVTRVVIVGAKPKPPAGAVPGMPPTPGAVGLQPDTGPAHAATSGAHAKPRHGSTRLIPTGSGYRIPD